MGVKFKVIEGELKDFENEMNEFISREDVSIIKVQYSSSGLAPDTDCGWNTCYFHSALITYNKK